MIDLLRTRRSVRKFQPRPLEPAAVELLQEAVLRAPSSRGRNPWEFVFVDDRALLVALARAKPHGSSFLAGAALAIVVCGNEQICDVWVEDCSIAAFIAHGAAHSLSLGSCWIQIRARPHDEHLSANEYVAELLAIPDRLQVEAIIAIGYPAEDKPPHRFEELDRGKLWLNRYG